jgi:iron complex outermembrane receptor protein
MKKQSRLLLIGLGILSNAVSGWAQEADTLSAKTLMSMSLEELMNVQVVSASKKEESLFDAPLSASVLSWEEIQQSGATSIIEALRLVPGLIVRQETNGNYNIHIRGLDNVPPNSQLVYAANTTTLVMIDNRPVYSYMQGGTFWESLPIDLNDVEKIEVVRGASATMYGPNAVSGVINIITRKTTKQGFNTAATAQYGSLQTAIANASIGYQFNDKFSAILSGNYQGRAREVSYYHPLNGQYYNTPDSLVYVEPNNKAPQRYPYPDRAMDKYGANLFLNLTPNQKVQLSLATGVQDSRVQNAYAAVSSSSLAIQTSRTGYADVKANAYGFSSQFSYLQGKQDPQIGFTGSTYDFSTADALVEYELKPVKNLSVKPGVNYRHAVYDDTPYWNAAKKEGLLSARTHLETYAGSVRVDYKAWADKVRLIGGARLDRFTYPKKSFLSFQLGGNFKPSDRHLFRAVYSRAFRSAFIYDTYLNILYKTPLVAPNIPDGSYTEAAVIGNKHLNMVQSDMMEIGYRSKVLENLSLDVEAYYTITKNYTGLVTGNTYIEMGATPTDPIAVKTNVTIESFPLKVHQRGVSLSVNYVHKRFQIKPFLTLQSTRLLDYSKYANLTTAAPSIYNGGNPEQNNLYSGRGTSIRHKFTPALFGGAYFNYQISQQFTLNISPYYYSSQTFYHADYMAFNDEAEGLATSRGVQHIDPKLLINANIAYSPVKPVSVFVSVKNLLNDNAREYYKTDQIGRLFLIGASVHF